MELGDQIGEITCGESPYLTRKRDQIKMRDYMDRRVTPSKRVTSPTWGPQLPCKQPAQMSPTCLLNTEQISISKDRLRVNHLS